MESVTLPPELERFATEAIAAGRYRDVAEVVAAGVAPLQRQEQAVPSCWRRLRLPGPKRSGTAT